LTGTRVDRSTLGELAELLRAAGLQDIDKTALTIKFEQASFEDWWEPFTVGIGRAGSYLARLGLGRARIDCAIVAARCFRQRHASSLQPHGRRVGT
jgi:hypothetical protein